MFLPICPNLYMPVHNHDTPKQIIEVEHDGKSVTGWDYQCPIGARTISTCSDEASVIGFWHMQNITTINTNMKENRLSLMDAAEGH